MKNWEKKRQTYRKIYQKYRKTAKNEEKPPKIRQKYRKIVKNIEKLGKKPSKMLEN